MPQVAPDGFTLHVTARPQVPEAGESARRLAQTLGFPSQGCDEIALVATELASNLIRHASGGVLRGAGVWGAGRTGIQIESEDDGPGITDIEQALADGYSTAGGLGTGLGTVNRLMDEVEFHSRSSGGVRIVCQRWVRPHRELAPLRWLDFGAATRSYHGIPENGDAFLFRQWEKTALVGVIDGLGHGSFAQRAAQAARAYVEQHFDQPLQNLFLGAGRACRATRGVVMALARLDAAHESITVASVGNVEVRLLGGPGHRSLGARRGIVGLNATPPAITEHRWVSDSLLIMHSDGVHPRWRWDEFPELHGRPAPLIAQKLLARLSAADDDATVVVARSEPP